MYDPKNGCVLGEEIAGTVETIGDVQTYGGGYYVGDPIPEQPANQFSISTAYPYCSCWHVTKSAREQVQDEILTKMAEAIEADDMKKAKKLVELAKALKEL